MKRSFYSGIFEPSNRDKYIGTTNPKYDSSWELKVYKFFDRNPNVIKWGAQMPQIQYLDPVKNKVRRYFVDVYVKYKDKQGTVREELIEIKPAKQTRPPRATKKKKKTTLLQEQATFATNTAKWQAGMKFCKERGWKFRILTENDIF